MNKHDLELIISRELLKQRGSTESFKAYQCISSYFADLSIEDLLGVASQYGIKAN